MPPKCTPCKKNNNGCRMHNSDAIAILNYIRRPLILFVHRCLEHIFLEFNNFQRCDALPAYPTIFQKLIFLSSRNRQTTGHFPGYFDSQAEKSVRVRKSAFMVETLRHYNLGPNVLFDSNSYIHVNKLRN